jgi:hypothetical protein
LETTMTSTGHWDAIVIDLGRDLAREIRSGLVLGDSSARLGEVAA